VSDSLLALFGRGWETDSGADVTPETSLQVTAVYACVRLLAEAEAGLPLILYRRLERGKERAGNHSLYTLLHDAPNDMMTAYEFRETLTGQVVLRGNGYAEIDWSEAGVVRGLWPLRADKTVPEVVGRELTYVVTLADGSRKRLPAWRVLHVRGFGANGIEGFNPIYLARQSVGLAMATEEFGARLFGNGAKPGGILEHPGKLSKEAQGRLQESIEKRHQGLSNAHRLMILEEGMSWKQVGMAPEDAQFLETRNYQTRDIARLFHVPPHMIGDLSQATFSNIEHQALEFVTHTLRAWLVRWEQRISQSLLSTSEQRGYFAEHLVDGLLRGDIASRYQAYNTGILAGFVTRNEVRERENMNPLDGLDAPLTPLNMAEVGEEEGDEGRGGMTRGQDDRMTRGEGVGHSYVERRSAEDVAAGRRRLMKTQEPLIADVAGRVVRREVNDVGRAVQKYLVRGADLAGFLLWLGTFYEGHAEFVAEQMTPALRAMGRMVLDQVAAELGQDGLSSQDAAMLEAVDGFTASMGRSWAASSRGQIEALLREEEDGAAAVQARLDGWAETQADKNGRRETVDGVNAFAIMAYMLGGVTVKRWYASGTSCPYCQSLSGKVVGIGERFVGGGASLMPEGAAEPMLVRRDTFHPAIHDGCDCVVLAG
jgi:HK97 family phage portal protein